MKAARIISLILIFTFLTLSVCSCFESKDYEPGEVIIVLTREESAKMIEYTPDDFSFVGCVEIRELFSDDAEKADHNRMFVLYIEDNSAEGIQHAVTVLESRDGIESATGKATVDMD